MNSSIVNATSATRDALCIFQAAIDAVRSDKVVRNRLRANRRTISIDEREWKISGNGRLIIVGAGKAAYGMLCGLDQAISSLDASIPVIGHLNIPEEVREPRITNPVRSLPSKDRLSLPPIELLQRERTGAVNVLEARPAAFNYPTDLTLEGTRAILSLVESARPDDLVICLLSGGASALLCSPSPPLTLNDKITATRLLSESGATIEELNSVRRCLSEIKGGMLAQRCRANQMVTLTISDVLGDSLAIVGSGPTFYDVRPDWRYALSILNHYDPSSNLLPEVVRDVIKKRIRETIENDGEHGITDTFKDKRRCRSDHVMLANNATAVDAAGTEAVRRGYSYWMESATRSESSAESSGEKMATQALDLIHNRQVDCIISGGEPTVKLPPVADRGKGGRNQQLVLSALRTWKQNRMLDDLETDFCMLSAGTDGEDGPTDAAGAWFDRKSLAEAQTRSLDCEAYLHACDAYSFFQQTDSLIFTGPTHTNVCDLRIFLVKPNTTNKPDHLSGALR